MKAKIYVTLKSSILDPQGRAIQRSLATLGFSTVNDVRVGKYLEVDLTEQDREQAESTLKVMCEKLLANPVIEEFRYDVNDT